MLQLRQIIIALFITCSLASISSAQALAEYVPDSAMIYIGWRGTADLSQEYEGSHLQAIVAETDLTPLIHLLFDEWEMEEPEVAAVANIFRETALNLKAYPLAVYSHGLQPSAAGGDTIPHLALICAAGDDAPQVVTQLTKIADLFKQLEAEDPGFAIPNRIYKGPNGLVTLVIGKSQKDDHDPTGGKGRGAESTLANHKAFKTAYAQTIPNSAICFYIDLEKLFSNVNAFAGELKENTELSWTQIYKALELDEVRSLTWAGGFAGKQWMSASHLVMPDQPKGIAKYLDREPVSQELFHYVPEDASWARIIHYDLEEKLDQIVKNVSGFHPDFLADFTQFMDDTHQVTGLDVQGTLLKSIGNEWIFYTKSGQMPGPIALPGFVITNIPRDMPAARDALQKMVKHQKSQPLRNIEVMSKTIEGTEIYIFSSTTGDGAVYWTITDDRLIFSNTLHMLATAIRKKFEAEGSIVQTDLFEYAQSMWGEHAKQASVLSVADMKRESEPLYRGVLFFTTILPQLLGAQTDESLLQLPSLQTLLANMSPAASVQWNDELGYHVRTASPFPGSTLLSTEGLTSTAYSAVGAGIFLPALGASRRSAKNMQMASQLRGIHQACVIFAQGNRMRFPEDIGQLVVDEYFTPEYALSPFVNTKVPNDFDRWPDEKKRQWVNENTSYILLPGITDDTDSERIALLTKPNHSDGRSIAIAWNDNHVTTELLTDEVRAMIKAKTGRTIEEWSGLVPEALP